MQRRGHVIANHTSRHDGLGALCKQGRCETARKYISDGAAAIERETGARPTLLCLPGTNGSREVVEMAKTAGMETMLVPRHCFGECGTDVGETIDALRRCGTQRADFLVHGVCKAGGGWMPFPTREGFVRYLDGIKSAEQAGKVVVTADYRN